MTNPDTSRHIEIKDGDQTVAAAEVTTSQDAGGTAQASLHAASGHIPPGTRASLVDAVMNLPEVQECARLKAAVPLGDSESLGRLREAVDDYDRYLARNSDTAEAWHSRGVALSERKRFEDAVASFTKALALRPDSATPTHAGQRSAVRSAM